VGCLLSPGGGVRFGPSDATASDEPQDRNRPSSRTRFADPAGVSAFPRCSLLRADRRERTTAESAARRIALNFTHTVETNAESSGDP
jgi:hypothetical protein